MAVQSVTQSKSQSARASGYQLHPEHRAAILAGSDSAKQAQEIERQRQAFIKANGDDGTH